jgi:SAM-dependent methyltransferase
MVDVARHWTEKMFIDQASLYEVTLEALVEKAEAEVEGLKGIFSEQGVPPGGSILDLACGIGRHSVLLAEEGYRVVGVDLSPTFIARAEESAAERGVDDRVEFRVGDMREIGMLLGDLRGEFNAVVNLFTSMGFWDEGTDREILRQLLDLSAPGGVLVVDIVNRDWLVRNFRARDFYRWEDGRVQLAVRRLDLESSRMFNVWEWYREVDGDLVHQETIEVDHRVYTLHELKRLAEESRWNYQTCYGGFDLEPLTFDSIRMMLVARKPGP